MKTILFGAGASVDESVNGRVPLTAELFETLRDCKDSWKNLSQIWAQEFQQSFEIGTQKLLDQLFDSAIQQSNHGSTIDFAQISAHPELRLWSDLQWDVAEYFLEHRIKDDSLYIQLLEVIKPHFTEFQLATLNYDTLLLQALERVKLIGSEISLACPIPICVPHGSSFFYCATPNYRKGNDGYIFYPGEVAGNPINIDENVNHVVIKAFGASNEFSDRRMDLFPPIMCYIEPNKRLKVGKKFIHAEQKKWENWVKSSDVIVIIGVNIVDADSHIWKPLEDTTAAILYISGSNSRNRFDSWCRRCGRSNPQDRAVDKIWADSQEEIFDFLICEN